MPHRRAARKTEPTCRNIACQVCRAWTEDAVIGDEISQLQIAYFPEPRITLTVVHVSNRHILTIRRKILVQSILRSTTHRLAISTNPRAGSGPEAFSNLVLHFTKAKAKIPL